MQGWKEKTPGEMAECFITGVKYTKQTQGGVTVGRRGEGAFFLNLKEQKRKGWYKGREMV